MNSETVVDVTSFLCITFSQVIIWNELLKDWMLKDNLTVKNQ